jgi:LAO/AO transport system kinase
VNKADRDGAGKVAADVKVMLDLIPERNWRPPVSLASAMSGRGIDELMKNIESHREFLMGTPDGKSRRLAKIENEVEEIMRRGVFSRVEAAWKFERSGGVLEDIENRKTDPYTVAEAMLNKIVL